VTGKLQLLFCLLTQKKQQMCLEYIMSLCVFTTARNPQRFFIDIVGRFRWIIDLVALYYHVMIPLYGIRS